MSVTTLRTIIAAVLFIHGVGHFMGVMPALRLVDVKGWNSHSWLLTPLVGEGVARFISIVLFLAALVGFLATALAVMGWLVPHDPWRPLALVSAVISLVAIVLFWNAFVSFIPNKLGAIVVNVATLVCLLGLDWPTEADLGFSVETCYVLRVVLFVDTPHNTKYAVQIQEKEEDNHGQEDTGSW